MIRRIAELYQYRELIRNLVIRDLKVRYKNSVLGVLWSLLNPLLMTLVFTVVFTLMIPSDIARTFPVFFLCGFLPWSFLLVVGDGRQQAHCRQCQPDQKGLLSQGDPAPFRRTIQPGQLFAGLDRALCHDLCLSDQADASSAHAAAHHPGPGDVHHWAWPFPCRQPMSFTGTPSTS